MASLESLLCQKKGKFVRLAETFFILSGDLTKVSVLVSGRDLTLWFVRLIWFDVNTVLTLLSLC